MNIGKRKVKMMKAKAFLKQIEKLDKMIENKTFEVEYWKSIANGTTAQMGGERVQSSGSQQKMADAVVKYIELENEVARQIDVLIDTKKDVINVIEQLDPIEYDLLHKHYVQHFTLYEIAALYGNSYSWAVTIHGRALKNVQNILDGRKMRWLK